MPKLRLCVLLGVFFSASAPLAAAPPASTDAQAAAVERGLLPALVVEGVPPWTLAERMRHYHVPGVSIALIQGGRIAWARGYGVLDLASKVPVTPKTLFQAGSLSKTVAAVAVLKLADQGKLSLSAPVNTLLKTWKLPEGPYTAGVNLERILSHSAGLSVPGFSGYAPGAPLPTLLETLEGKPPANNLPVRVANEPGQGFSFSGGGFEVAQQLVQDVTGRPFTALLEESVLRPTGMADSSFQQPLGPQLAERAATGHNTDGVALPGKWHVYPELAAAGLWTTASDLAQLAIAVQQARAGAPEALLTKAMATRMLTAATFGDGGFSLGNGLGLTVDQRGKGTFSQISVETVGGLDGYRALLVASTEGGFGLVVMTNGDGGARLADEVVRSAASVYGWKPLAATHLKRGQPSEDQLRRLSGRYRFGSDDVLSVSNSHSGLKGQPLLGESFELIAVEGGNFVRADPPARYTFDATGVIESSVLGERSGLRVPSGESTPLQLLLAGKTDAALSAYRVLWKQDTKDPALAELRLNDLAYEVEKRSPEQALALFQLNTEFYPTSANTWDSLAEAYASSQQRDEALRCYQKVLEVVPKDSHLPTDIKALLLQNAERKVKELQGGG